MRLTDHAEQRRSRRRIPVDVLSTIYDFGTSVHANGAVSLTLDRHTIALASDGDRRKRSSLERYHGCYIIVGDGENIVTVARRRRRHRR